RTRLTSGRETAVICGILLSGSLPAVLGFLHFDEAQRLSLLGWIAVAFGIPAFTLLLRTVPLPKPVAPAQSSWRGITDNRLFVRLLGAWFLNGLANGIPAILFPLFCSQVLETSDQTRNLLLALYFGSAVIGIPLWLTISRRFSKHHSWSLAMTITCPAFAVAAFLGPGDTTLFAVVCLVTGLCLGADLALPPAIQADVADWDRLRFRRNRTASLFALWNMASKLALAIAAGTILPLVSQLGLEQPTPPADSLRMLAMIYALIPCVFKLTAIALVSGLPLTQQRHAAIISRLDRRDYSAEGRRL
ncbi:MAG TPA: MFS transporter, partial [Gammaproteobacteria bacterium]|nr:MFS transporter [Gammaproteobacteria bacterium]